MGLLEEAGVEKGKGKRKRLEFDRVEFGERRDVDEFKLCGFVEAILCASQGPDPGEDFVNAEIELGASCRLEGQGNETYLEVEGSKTILVQRIIRKGDFLVSVENATASNHGVNGNRIQTEERTPGTAGTPGSGFPVSSCVSSPELEFKIDEESGSKSRRRGEGSTGRRDRHGVHGILEQLQHMEKKNKVRIGGMVVNKVQLGLHKYFVVLLDVYIPDAFFTARRSCWKGGPVIAGCLSHLRCDWDKRSQILERKQSHNLEGISNVGVCHVLGCKLHREQSGTEKAERFDLHALFKSLPSCLRHGTQLTTTLQPGSEDGVWRRGLWQMPDDVLSTILTKLLPSDLHNVAAVSRHFRALSASIMPCMNLKLFPHQESAVRWMLQRELTSRTLPHPYSGQLLTAYGIPLYFDEVTGDLSLEAPLPVTDFKGGLFCDEPGLGKTVTALSLILKTQGTLATPPPGVTVHWCEHTSDQKSGYYEVSTSSVPCGGMSALKRCSVLKARRYQFDSAGQWPSSWNPRKDSHTLSPSVTTPPSLTFGSNAAPASWTSPRRGSHYLSSSSASYSLDVESHALLTSESTKTPKLPISFKRRLWDSGGKDAKKSKRCSHSANGKNVAKQEILPDCDDNELWSQCDACGKWRKIPKEGQPLEEGLAWFCSMNKDQLHQDCSVPEEIFDKNEMIKSLPGFVHSEKGADREVNVPFFRTVLRDHAHHIDEEAKRALRWLIDLPRDKVLKGAVGGLQLPPTLQMASVGGHDLHQYDKIFDAFGLVKKKEAKKVTKWFYPRNLDNLVFDTVALREALAEPVEED